VNSDSAQSFDQQGDLVRSVRLAGSTESHFRHALAAHRIFIYPFHYLPTKDLGPTSFACRVRSWHQFSF
jgi:hypothetical protein